MADIIHQFMVMAPAQKVFEAFTSPEGLNNWWTCECTGKAEKGAAYRFYFSEEYDWSARVEKVVKGKALSWKMTKAMDDWMPTELGFILKERKEGTSVHFYHKNWKEANEHFGITNFCWGQLLNGLKNYVEKGIVVPFENRN